MNNVSLSGDCWEGGSFSIILPRNGFPFLIPYKTIPITSSFREAVFSASSVISNHRYVSNPVIKYSRTFTRWKLIQFLNVRSCISDRSTEKIYLSEKRILKICSDARVKFGLDLVLRELLEVVEPFFHHCN